MTALDLASLVALCCYFTWMGKAILIMQVKFVLAERNMFPDNFGEKLNFYAVASHESVLES